VLTLPSSRFYRSFGAELSARRRANTELSMTDRWPLPLHPLNAALRFALELVALGLFGRWGFMCRTADARYLWMLVLPLLAAVIWGTFTVPGDPSRGKTGPMRVSGAIRLAVEAAFFAAAAAACYALSTATWAAVFVALVCLHYVWAHARTRWLLAQH
jgi:hypothetical protein